ncbi:spermidine/putrescine ABC transporter substrate-binding protein PotF [Sessilibacter sp. MAH1]
MRKLGFLTATFLASISLNTIAQDDSNTLRVYNWSDYIGEGVVSQFEEETGIDVIYDTYDSNLEVEEKINLGGGNYDVVVPSLDFMAKQLRRGLFRQIDKSKLKNYSELDPTFLKNIAKLDTENAHGVPYMWGTTGFGYNVEQVRKILGPNAPVNSWDLIFKPENLKKLSACGVSFLDEPTEMLSIGLNYLKKDPNSEETSDYLNVAGDFFKQLSQYVNVFDSADFLDNLSNGKICVAIGWSGDIFQAMANAEESDNGVKIKYVIPKEGTVFWVDMLAIPELTRNEDAALKFIDFLLRPEIAAKNTNYIWYANAVTNSLQYVDDEIKNDPTIYPTPDIQAKLFQSGRRSIRIRRTIEQSWGNVISEYLRYHPEPFNPDKLDHNTQNSEKLWQDASENLLQK